MTGRTKQALAMRFDILILFGLVLVALVVSFTMLAFAGVEVWQAALWLLAGVIGVAILASLVKSRYGIYYSLILTVIASTVHREHFDFPIEFDALAIGLLALLLALKSSGRLFGLLRNPLLISVVGWVLVGFFSTYLNGPTLGALYFQGKTLLYWSLRQSLILAYRAATFFLVMLVAQRYTQERFHTPLYLFGIMLFQVIISLFALALYPLVGSTPFIWEHYGGSYMVLQGFLIEPNLFAIFVLMVVALILPTAAFSRGLNKWILTLGIIIGLIGVLLSYTRSAWLGFGVVLLVWGASTLRLKRHHIYVPTYLVIALFASFLIVIGIVGAAAVGVDRAETLAVQLAAVVDTKSATVAGRIIAWQLAIERWMEQPWFGHGLLSLSEVWYIGWAYNGFIQTLHDTGVIGLLFLLLIYLQVVSLLVRACRRAVDQKDKLYLLGYLLGLVALWFCSLTSSFLWSAFAWIFLGLAVGHSRAILLSLGSHSDQAHTVQCTER